VKLFRHIKGRTQAEVIVAGVLSKICGSELQEITGRCSKLHYEEIHEWYSSQKNLWVIKPTRMSCKYTQ
jgi:hypothetical protein